MSKSLPRLPGQPETKWTNWAGNQSCSPSRIERPITERHLQEIVRRAVDGGQRVRAVGHGHSFTTIACSDDILVSIDHLNLVRSIDHDKNQVTIDAGIELSRLNVRLAKEGLAMSNLGDIAYQTAAGAISTSTHGTGLGFGGLATQVVGLRLVTATGDIVDCSANENPELFHVARVGLGVFGIISQLTLQVEPAFNLHAVERPQPIGVVLDGWSSSVREHDHFEFFWIPGTELAMTKTNRRTQDPVAPLSKIAHVRDKIVGENLAFGAITKLAKMRPSMIPKLSSTVAAAVSEAEYTDVSYKVFTSKRWVKFVEMEYSVPVDDLPSVVRRIDEAVRAANIPLLFPIEARAAAADDIPLSTATGRDSGYVAVHRGKGQPYRQYFELVEAIVDEFDGRPHWGKMHFQTASTLQSRYPQWGRFQQLRAELDPTGVFTNAYTDLALGPAR